MWYNRKSRPLGFAVVNDQIACGPSRRARRSPAVRHCTASSVRRKETRAASRKSPAVQSLYPFPPHAARSRPPPMPPHGGIGGGRSCSAARRVLHTFPSGRGFEKAPRNGRQPAGGTGIRQKERKWLSAVLCCGSMRRPPAKRRKKSLFGKAGHTVNRNASLIKGLHSHSQTGRSVQRRPKRRRKQRRPRATAGEARFPPARGICRPTVRKVCRPTTKEVRCPTAGKLAVRQ